MLFVFLFGKVYFLWKYFGTVHSLFCPSLIRTHSEVHFCTSTQFIFRGISLYFFWMQKHKRLLSCIKSQFFYCSNNQVFFYCSNNQVIFIVLTIKLSYQLLFSIFTRIATPWQNPPFVRTLLPLLVARLDYHLYFNFSTEKYSTAICYFCLTSQRQRHQLWLNKQCRQMWDLFKGR